MDIKRQDGPDRNLEHLYPAFRAKLIEIQAELDAYAAKHMPGIRWKLTEGFRTAAYQQRLYALGRTKPGRIVTNRDGIKRESNHQSSLAADFVPFRDKKPIWDAADVHWQYLGHLARACALVWGGDWKSFVDTPHVEWPESDAETYRLARAWQRTQGLRQ